MKKKLMSGMLKDFEREIKNYRRWEDDIRDAMKYGSHFDKLSRPEFDR